MKTIRVAGTFLMTTMLVLSLAGCGKQNEDQISSAPPEETPATTTESAPSNVNPPANESMQPAETPATNPSTASTHAVSHSKSVKSTVTKHSNPKTVAASQASETRTVSLPAGASFDVELTTAINTGTNKVGDPVEG